MPFDILKQYYVYAVGALYIYETFTSSSICDIGNALVYKTDDMLNAQDTTDNAATVKTNTGPINKY